MTSGEFMKKPEWEKLIGASADPVRARQFLDSFTDGDVRRQLKELSAESKRVLVTVLGASGALGELLLAKPEWLPLLEYEHIRHPRQLSGFQREVHGLIAEKMEGADYAGALTELRRFKQRETLRIAARDLMRLGSTVQIIRELSDMADVCLEALLQICLRQLLARHGQPYHQDIEGRWQKTAFCVMGLGKLGGQELNYSSDVDLMFVYAEEGSVFKETPGQKQPPRSVMSNHQFFCKVAEMFVAEVSRATGDGFLFRIDLRLRPEGDAGPLTRSLESHENYYAEWGQTWERMMLIKARHVAGDVGLASEFLEMIQPFRFPQSISGNILREVAAVKDRIEKEVVRADELERNVKLGRGGIREVEFCVQSLQVLHAGTKPFLQLSQTLPCLDKLAEYNYLTWEDARQLGRAYCFLRDVEHRLQMEENRQTHTIPEENQARARLAALMGFKLLEDFEAALQEHKGNVRRVYDRLLKSETPEKSEANLPENFEESKQEWEILLEEHSFRDPHAAVDLFKEFAEGPGYVHVPTHTTDLARQLIVQFLALCPKRGEQPDVSAQDFSQNPRTELLNVAFACRLSHNTSRSLAVPALPRHQMSGSARGKRGRCWQIS